LSNGREWSGVVALSELDTEKNISKNNEEEKK
jgi:hypothetical protein